ncbi:MAG: hypothetical protein JW854_06930 [Actinobacteria bacterium]|nr:hypothetical protein [Actinomycetota bacterium]
MYSDYEVECLYLGKPFEDRTIHCDDISSPVVVSKKDIEKVRSAIPLLSMLVDAACPAAKCA